MKRKSKITALVVLMAMLVTILGSFGEVEQFQAANSYTNAKVFYESTAKKDVYYHADAANGKVYYATQAKLASSSTNTKYYTVGFDVTLSGNGHSVSFTVQRTGGSMVEVDSRKDGGYEYILYAITEDRLYELASKANSTSAAYVLSASTINVQMDAIMTIKKGNTQKGGIAENGYGGFTSWGSIYRLKNSTDLKELKEIFLGHKFKSYTDIREVLNNYRFKVRYNVLGLHPIGSVPTLSNNVYTFDSAGVLHKSGAIYFDESRTLKKITLLNTGIIGVSKTGYHLPSGKEWVTDDSRYFASSSTHQSTTVDPIVGYKDHSITLYANWKPNTYTIKYNANGGTGNLVPSNMVYDIPASLRTNTFSRAGYRLKEGAEWNTKADGTGVSYSSEQVVQNLTATNGGTVTLYANWEPCVYQITVDKQEGAGGVDFFFEKYSKSFFLERGCISAVTGITIPQRTGYDFLGYYQFRNGNGTQIIQKNGAFATGIDSKFFTRDSLIFANWQAKQFRIFFDKQGGIGGTDSVVAIYNRVLPSAEAPVRVGYTFKGYYLDKAFADEGKEYYTDDMAPKATFLFEKDITVYAKWVDDTSPSARISVSTNKWTNMEGGIQVQASAYDLGSGLSKIELYCEGEIVESRTNLNGTTDVVTVAHTHTKEGAFRYQIIAYDMIGNVAEVYEVCLYDITNPTGSFGMENEDVTNFYIDVDVSDYILNP